MGDIPFGADLPEPIDTASTRGDDDVIAEDFLLFFGEELMDPDAFAGFLIKD